MRSGFGQSRRSRPIIFSIALGVSASFLVAAPVQAAQVADPPSAQAPPAAEESAGPALVKPTDTDDDGKLDAPDSASAAAGAAAADKSVEDLSQRTETSTLTTNPDGSKTLKQFEHPVRVKVNGSWADVDSTLVKQDDGSFRPKVSATEIVVGAGGTKDAGEVTFEDGHSVAITWPQTLPKPSIDGNTATYKLSETTDLLMIVAGNGVAARLRLNERPASNDPVFTFGLRTDDLTLAETSGGGLTMKDDDGKTLGTTTKLVAWDAKTDAAGEPLEKVALDADLDQTAKAGDVTTHELDLTAPDGYLADPDTQFPVIIDPDTRTLGANSDTFVRYQDNVDHGADADLQVGRQSVSGSNLNPSISYIKWNMDQIPNGATVQSAQIGLRQFYAGSCSATSVVVQPLADNWRPSDLFSNKPTALSVDYGYITQNMGNTCASGPGHVTVSATTWVSRWIDYRDHGVGYPAYGLRFGVPQANEQQVGYGRRFCSYNSGLIGNCPNANYEPYLQVTYNQGPRVPTGLDVTNGGNPATVYATVSDPNGEANLRGTIRVRRVNDPAIVWQGTTSAVAVPQFGGSGEVSLTLPYLADGDYEFTVAAVDDSGFSSNESPAKAFSIETEYGTQPWFSTSPHSLDSSSAVQVNNRTGNVVIQARDLNVNGRGLDLDITRFYNSQLVAASSESTIPASDRWSTTLGRGWSLSVGPDVWMQKRGNNFIYHAPGGTVFGSFKPDANDANKYVSPVGGVGADLSKSGGTYTLKFRKSQLRYEFEEKGTSGHLYQTKIRDKSGNEIIFGYSGTTPNGRAKLTAITDASDRTYAVTYTGDYLTSISETSGANPRTWTYTIASDRLTKVTNPDQKVTEYSYLGYFVYVIAGPDRVNGSDGSITQFIYFSSSSPQRSRIGQVVYATGDGNTTPTPFVWSYKRRGAEGSCNSGADYSTTVKDARTNDTAYCFHKSNSVDTGGKVRVYDALGRIKSTTYTADKGIATVTTPSNQGSGISTQASYPSTGFTDRLNSVTEPKNADDGSTKDSVTRFDYGSGAAPGTEYLPRAVVGADGKCSAFEYDSQGRTTAAYTGIQYQDASQSCSKDQKIGSHRLYNSYGAVSESWDENAYGAGENDSDELSAERKTIYTYWTTSDGAKGQLKSVRKPGGSCDAPRKLCTSYEYDARGRVTSVRDGRDKVTNYTYDGLDRTTGVFFDGATTCAAGNVNCVTYGYDGAGNLVSRIDKTGTSSFVYDRSNRLTKQTTPGVVIDLKYDRNSNLTFHSQSLLGQTSQITTYGYDAANRLNLVHSDGIGTSTAGDIGISRDEDGRVKQFNFPGQGKVFMNYNYTRFGKPKSANVKAQDEDVAKRAYSYDYKLDLVEGPGTYKVSTDKLRNRTIGIQGQGNNQSIDYAYDENNISSAVDDNGPDFYYTHDKVGNVTSEDSAGTETFFGYDRAGQLCWRGQADSNDKLNQDCSSGPQGSTNFVHDAAGNNTNTAADPIVYNDDSQVSTIDGISMGYLDRGNSLRTSAGSTTEVNSPLGVTARTTTAGSTYYVRDPNGQILASYGAGGTLFYFSEFNGSVAALYTPAGDEGGAYTYSPYGQTTVTGPSGPTNPFRYIGGLQDSGNSSYYKLGARYYDGQGHFTQPDPIVLGGGTYDYTAGDPVNRSDPSGLYWGEDTVEGAGDAITDAARGAGDVGADLLEGTAAGLRSFYGGPGGQLLSFGASCAGGATVAGTGGAALGTFVFPVLGTAAGGVVAGTGGCVAGVLIRGIYGVETNAPPMGR